MAARTGTATVTATTGPGRTVTAIVISGIKAYFVNIEEQMLYFYLQNDDVTGPMRQFALSDTVTMTTTISAGVWTIEVVVS